jgi:hypothetical protein
VSGCTPGVTPSCAAFQCVTARGRNRRTVAGSAASRAPGTLLHRERKVCGSLRMSPRRKRLSVSDVRGYPENTHREMCVAASGRA